MNVKDENKWYKCPICKQKLLKYDGLKGKSKGLYIKCKKCKRIIEIKINDE